VWEGVEQCDDGNTVDGDACTNRCTAPGCGDGIVQAGEECDDANTSNDDACLNTCRNASCGDTFVRTGVEQCDDGNTSNTDACLDTCRNAACGDTFTWIGREACDDGNQATEFCGTACLGVCEMAAASCGNGTLDPGEQCDDGNTSSTDTCTTSCTTNDHGIGAPCTCTSGCSDTNFTAGTIVGCENVVVPTGSGGVRACMRSIREATSGTETYYAEGYCTIMAVTCSGLLCGMVPQPGNYGTMTCPAGTYRFEDSRSVMGMTIRSRSCLLQCASDLQCRWRAYDAFRSACGRYECSNPPGTTAVEVCFDRRQF
jgi:cysteine-rich repeat protein